MPWLLPAGPPRNRMLPPSGRFLMIQLRPVLAVGGEVGADPLVVVLRRPCRPGRPGRARSPRRPCSALRSAGSTALPASGKTTIALTPLATMPWMSEIAFWVLPWPSAYSKLGHARALGDLVLGRSAVVTRRQLLPPKPSVQAEADLLGAAPGRGAADVGGGRLRAGGRRCRTIEEPPHALSSSATAPVAARRRSGGGAVGTCGWTFLSRTTRWCASG